MLHAATFGALSLVGATVGEMAAAEGLVLQCGDYSYDLTRSTFAVDGRDYGTTIEGYDEGTGRFTLRLSPADGLPVERAQLQAVMVSDIFCMRLDKLPVAVSAGLAEKDSWLFQGGCTGDQVRMAEKC